MLLLAAIGTASADTTPQPLPFTEDWTAIDRLTAANNWDNVPGIIGYRGAGLATGTAVDPQTVLAPADPGDVNVAVSVGNPNNHSAGGVAEIEVENPSIALQGSGSANAPHIVIAVNTTGVAQVRVQYVVRDMENGSVNAIQPLALQYRVGTSGDFINVPAGYVADATEGPSIYGPDLPFDITLPAEAGNVPHLEIRFITTDAVGADELVGIDDISITAAGAATPTDPSATGLATPATAQRGDTVLLTAQVTPGTNPASTDLGVLCDLSAIGGDGAALLVDDGTSGDATAGDSTFSLSATIGATTAFATHQLPCDVSDAENRSAAFTISLTVVDDTAPVCGDGMVEGTEACDDSNTDAGDGCSATCTVEAGYACTPDSPSLCTDIDECTEGTDNCDDHATCTNTPGSFSCACEPGYSGDGVTCSDVDECAKSGDTCDENASCTNAKGSYACECNAGYEGDGMSCEATCGDGILVGGETCDDGNTMDGDGCDAACEVEPGYTCEGTPSQCVPDDPMNPSNPDDDDDGGCCSTSRGNAAGSLALALVVLGVVGRRRRR